MSGRQSVYDNGGLLGATKSYFISTPGASITTFTFVGGEASVNSPTVNLPAGTQAGDIAVVWDSIGSLSSDPAAPSGFTSISSARAGNPNHACVNAYKILDASDISAGSVTSSQAATTDHFLNILVFRPDAGTLTGVTTNDVTIQVTTSNPTLQTLNVSGETNLPVLAFFFMAQRGSNNSNLTNVVAPSGYSLFSSDDESGRDVMRSYYQIYSTLDTPADATGDIGDNGAQGLASCYLTFTASADPDVTTYNSGIWNLQAVLEALSA
jgi:hypothetical protein